MKGHRLFHGLKWTAAGLLLALAGTGCRTQPGGHLRSLKTPLDRYVAQPDPSYAWRLVRQDARDGVTVSVIRLTSQSWLTTNEVNHPRWWHWLVIYTPDRVAHDTALLMIGGGSNKDTDPPEPGKTLARIAKANQSVTAELRMVPNQPLVFDHDGHERSEDDLVAYTWGKFLRTGEARWLARLPMTKAAVRAMDTVTDFCARPEGGARRVDHFVVAGGSKRGWTTWTTAAVDRRVVAICPIVIDMLNLVPSFIHHYRAYGFYAPAVKDYVEQGIMDWLGTPEFRALLKVVEPYEYRHRLTMPKLLLNACGDQFFLPDSSQFYFADLPGVKYLRYVPNADHSLRDTDAPETLAAWEHAILNRTPLPRFAWEHAADGTIRVTTPDHPQAVRLWRATNPEARDFRLETLGPVWKSAPLTDRGDGVYEARVPAPARGWTACMVELTWNLGGPAPLKTTTPVWVLPDTLPFPPPARETPETLRAR